MFEELNGTYRSSLSKKYLDYIDEWNEYGRTKIDDYNMRKYSKTTSDAVLDDIGILEKSEVGNERNRSLQFCIV